MADSRVEFEAKQERSLPRVAPTYDTMRLLVYHAGENWVAAHFSGRSSESLRKVIDSPDTTDEQKGSVADALYLKTQVMPDLLNPDPDRFPRAKFPLAQISDDFPTFLIISTPNEPYNPVLLIEAQKRKLKPRMDAAFEVPRDLVQKITLAHVAEKEAPVGSH